MIRKEFVLKTPMNKFLKVMFALVIVAMTGAAILQIVAPEYMGSNAAMVFRPVGSERLVFGISRCPSFWSPLVSTTLGLSTCNFARADSGRHWNLEPITSSIF